MAQRKCRECGELVSTSAKTCPKCGSTRVNADLEAPGKGLASLYPLRKILYPIGIIMLIIGIAGFITADQFKHYVYSILFLLIGGLCLSYLKIGKIYFEKQYAKLYEKVVMK